MTEYEDLGDKLKWKHDRNNSNDSTVSNSSSDKGMKPK